MLDVLENDIDDKLYLPFDKYKNMIMLKDRSNEHKLNQIADLNNGGYEMSQRVYDINALCPTLTCGCNTNILDNDNKVRKLSSDECFKLMGMTKEDCEKCREIGVSEAQLRKQAGNGIVTSVIAAIMEELYNISF